MHNIPKLTYLSIALLTTGLIAFQLTLIQIFSITQWYHYAYMIISVAMLGFGVAGTLISLFEKWILQNYSSLFPSFLFLTSISMALVVGVSNTSLFRFDSYLIFTDYRQAGRLLLTYLLFFIPFLFAALAIGMTYVRFVKGIGQLYFADLFGSGLGGFVGISLMWLFLPWEIPGSLAILPLLAGMIALKKSLPLVVKWLGLLASVIIVYTIFHPPQVQLSEFKSIRKTLLLPEARVEFEKNSPHGMVQVVASPVLRYAPGLSLTYQQSVPVYKVIFNNGDWLVLSFSTR